MLKVTVAESRLFLAMTSLALWAAWIRFVQFGLASNVGGLVLFAVACIWFLREQRTVESSSPASPTFLYASFAFVLVYVAGFFFVPPLGRGILAMEALALGMLACYPPARARERFGLIALLPLTLPLDMALQFVLGYPLRRASAVVASLILAPYGAVAEGTILHCRAGSLDVDAPCSGVYGLWAFLILGSLLAIIYKSGYKRTTVLLALAGLAGWIYNILRTCVLFMFQFHFGPMSETAHVLLGALAFVLVLGIYAIIGNDPLRRRVLLARHWRPA